jgi:membrane protein required for colicin V production
MLFGKNAIDIIIVAILAFSTLYSFLKGVVREIFALLALVAGIVLARRYYYQAAQGWQRWIGSQASYLISFILLFLATYLIIILAGRLFRRILKTAELSWLDHLGGAFLGLVKGGLLVCLLVFFLVMILSPRNRLMQTSRLMPHVVYLISFSEVLMETIPPEIRKGFIERVEELRRLWRQDHPRRRNNRRREIEFSGETLEAWQPFSI